MANLMKIVLDLTVRVGELETEIKTLRKPTTPQTPTSETETKTLRKPIIPPTPISSAKMTKGDTILYDASKSRVIPPHQSITKQINRSQSAAQSSRTRTHRFYTNTPQTRREQGGHRQTNLRQIPDPFVRTREKYSRITNGTGGEHRGISHIAPRSYTMMDRQLLAFLFFSLQ